MLFAEMSDVTWQAIIAAVVTIVLAYLQQRNKNAAAADTAKVEAKVEEVSKIAVSTHAVVNGKMALQLQRNATVTRRLATLTKEPADIIAAELAEKLYHEHMAKQTLADQVTELVDRSAAHGLRVEDK